MKPPPADPVGTELMSEILILPDGTIYVHNLTAPMAAALSALNPGDLNFLRRVPGALESTPVPPPPKSAA